MGEFFQGWRRKAGLVTLAMACVLTVGWMRSYVVEDVIEVVNHGTHFPRMVYSADGILAIDTFRIREEVVVGGPVGIGLRIPYLFIVLPLTLLSAWLILGKRPKAASGRSATIPAS